MSRMCKKCKKLTSVSHISTESDIISLDAGVRMDGILALDLWDLVMEVVHSSKNTDTPTQQAAGDRLRKEVRSTNSNRQRNTVIEMLMNCRMWTA